MVWDPRGIWTPTEAGRVCADLGLVLCTDPLAADDRPPTSSAPVYFRISGLGRRQSLTDDDLEFLQVGLYGGSGFCILDTVEMFRDAERLLALRSNSASALAPK